MEGSKGLMEVFSVFRNKESYFEGINQRSSDRLMLKQVAVVCLLTCCYGMVMGSYHSFIQAVSAGLKVTMLFIFAIIICFPSFFIIQQVLGSMMTIRQMIMIVLSGLVLTATIICSFIPIVIFFQLTGGNYHFLQLLHVSIFVFAGFFGLRLMVEALKYACEIKAIYPEIGVKVFKIWVIILAFVSIQLSWNLRPFLCEKNEPFKIFRKHEGNFYTAIVYSIEQLTATKRTKEPVYVMPPDSWKEDSSYAKDTIK